MSLSNEWTEWHLTPRGWESGSEKVDFGGVTTVTPPVDRVLTCRYGEFVGAVGARLKKSFVEMWRSDDGRQVSALPAAFGECPQHL